MCPHLSACDCTCGLMHGFPFNGKCVGIENCPYKTDERNEYREGIN